MKVLKCLKKLSLILLLFLSLNQNSFGQKNQVKLQTLKLINQKFDISYERTVYKNISLIAGYQNWFVDKEEKDKGWFFVNNRDNYTVTNKGNRLSLELRGTFLSKQNENSKRNFYIGLGGFSGEHKITSSRKAYSVTERYTSFWGGEEETTTTYYSERYGEVELISSGVFVNLGFQMIFNEKFVLDFGFLVGKAWNNIEKDILVVAAEDPLEEDENKFLDNNISGSFVEPVLSFGIVF